MRNLYEITGELAALEEQIVEAGGEFTPEIETQLDQLEGDFTAKLEAMARLLKNWKPEEDACREEAKNFTARASALDRSKRRLQAWMIWNLTLLDRRKVEGDKFKIAIQRNGRPSIEWREPDLLPSYIEALEAFFELVVKELAPMGSAKGLLAATEVVAYTDNYSKLVTLIDSLRAGLIPEEFRRVAQELDGNAIYDVWKETGEVPAGFQVSTGEHIRVR